MPFSDFDSFIVAAILDYCVKESSFSLVLTCGDFKDLIYSTPRLLYDHCKNINYQYDHLMKNCKKQRYQYTWWLIQNMPKSLITESSEIKILDVNILQEFMQQFPTYFSLLKWKKLCFQALFFDKMDVFVFIWKMFGLIIMEQETKFINSNYIFTYYPIACALLYLGKYKLIVDLYLQHSKDFSANFWKESLTSLYHYFYDHNRKSLERLINFDKRLRTDFRNVFLIDIFNDQHLWWMVILFNDKNLFLYNISLLKETPTTFIKQCCSDILHSPSDCLYFYVYDNWEILDNKGEYINCKNMYRERQLFDLIFDFVQNLQDDTVIRHFIYQFVKNTSIESFEHGISRMKQLALKTPLLNYSKKIISGQHFSFLIEMKTVVSYTKVHFNDCSTALHVLQYLKKQNCELSVCELNSLELEVFINLMKCPNKVLFDFWLENYIKHDSDFDQLRFLMNAEVCDKDFLDDKRFKNNAQHLDYFLQHYDLNQEVLKEYVSLFENNNSLILVNHFIVFKKHGLLQDLLKMGDIDWIISINPGIKLWLKINKD